MNFDFANLATIFIFSAFGMGYFVFGKKQHNIAYMIAGIALMGFGYFTEPMWVSLLVGLGLLALPKVLRFL